MHSALRKCWRSIGKKTAYSHPSRALLSGYLEDAFDGILRDCYQGPESDVRLWLLLDKLENVSRIRPDREHGAMRARRCSIRVKTGAAEGTRTPDPRFTKAVLYQLSYRGTGSVLRHGLPDSRPRGQTARRRRPAAIPEKYARERMKPAGPLPDPTSFTGKADESVARRRSLSGSVASSASVSASRLRARDRPGSAASGMIGAARGAGRGARRRARRSASGVTLPSGGEATSRGSSCAGSSWAAARRSRAGASISTGSRARRARRPAPSTGTHRAGR